MSNIKSVIEFGTSKIICMIDSSSIKGMDIPASSCVRYEGILNGHWVNADALPVALEEAVGAAEKKCARQIRSAYVGVPADFGRIVLKEVSHDAPSGMVTLEMLKRMAESAKPKDMPEYSYVELRPVYFTDSSDTLYVDLPVGVRTKNLSAMFSYFFVKKEFMRDVTSALNGMHIYVNRFVNEVCEQAIHYIPENDRFATAILVDVGYTETSVSAIYNDAVLATDVINMGGESIVYDLSKALNINTQVAESLKRGHVFGLSYSRGTPVFGRGEDGRMMSFDQPTVRDTIEDRMLSLCAAIKSSIIGFTQKRIVSRNATVFLSGAGIVMKGAETFVQNNLNKTVYAVKNIDYPTFTPVYNAALSLLDNNMDRDYDLCGGVYQEQIKSRLGKLFK